MSLKLTGEDQAWLDAYRRELLVVIKDGDWWLKRDVRRCGYRLAVATEVVPSIMVFTATEWGSYAARRAPFYRTVSRDGVSIS